MKIKLITVGSQMPSWVKTGYENYTQRLPNYLQPMIIEIPLAKRSKSNSIAQIKQQEAKKILSHIHPDDYAIALEIQGKNWSTEQLSAKIKIWQQAGKNIIFIIGGPDGLDNVCLDRANEKWSLSPLTLPHPLVRVLLAEQLYRGHTILQGHPYHRG